jgi:hypothetical protein
MTRLLALSVAILSLLVFASAATAATPTCASAPGTSALDQYCETIPGAGGGTATGGHPAGRTPQDAARSLPAAVAHGLTKSTATNRGILQLVADGPGAARGSSGSTGAAAGAVGEAAGDQPSSDPLGAVASAVTDGPTLNALLPLALVAILIVGGGIAWTRSRSRGAHRA